MEIILIRHGKPLSATNEKMPASGFIRWVRAYNKSDLDPNSVAHEQLDLGSYYVMSSKLKRARLSALHYTGIEAKEHLPIFNEMDIPRYKIPITLKAWHWVVLNRALWILGLKGPFESFSQAKARAQLAAILLDEKAHEHGKVAIFAHGMTNRYVRIYLQKRGWELQAKDNNYWGINKLVRS